MKNWKINSWRKFPVKHIPDYPDKKELDLVSPAKTKGGNVLILSKT
jgi:hypothetical protein